MSSNRNDLITFDQIEDGHKLLNDIETIQNDLANGNFEVNEIIVNGGAVKNSFMLGFDNHVDICDNLVFEVSGNSLFHDHVQILGTTIFGNVSTIAEDVSNNDTNVLVYGDLRIMDGGNIIVEDVSNTTITQLKTEVKITDILDISNDGTGPALTVTQNDTHGYDIVHFKDGGVKVFTIADSGKTYILGDVSMQSSLEISENLRVHNELVVDASLDVSGMVYARNNLIVGEYIGIGTTNPTVTFDISATDAIQIPVGISNERPSIPKIGQMRYNTTSSQFEGYSNSVWQGLGGGGVTDIDKDTHIKADTNNNLSFTTQGTERMKIDASGNIQMINSDSSFSALDISATSALRIPIGTNHQRPSDLKAGQIRYNTTTSQFEGYNTTDSWQGLGGVIDIDQDTKIIAETNPLDDNDEIQIFTAGNERMKVDASGNIRMIDSNPNYSALDISATSAVSIPRGTTSQRPTNSEIPRSLRFNSDTSLCEVYTESNIWSGVPVYKTEQPPPMKSISFTPSNQSVTVSWEKFADIYKDAYDGKCYPIFLQIYVDISFANIDHVSTNGWETIRIGNGNYDESHSATNYLTSISFESLNGTNYSNSTDYDISFTGNPTSTIDLPSFTQTDNFDLRVYAVNKSGTIPNYVYITGVGLKQTGEPGEVDVISFDTFSKTSFEIDVSFNLDASDSTVTSGVDIDKYDISYVLVDSKSLHASRTDSGILNLTSGSYDKSDIDVSGLFPGAKYDIQVRAKNAANSDFGQYGDVSTSTDFTQISSKQYIETTDLVSVTPNDMSLTLKKTKSISGYISDGTSISNKTITNENGYIDLSGTCEFYVNYAKQGKDMSGVDNLVEATVDLEISGSSVSSQTIIYNGTNDPSGVSVQTIDISNGGAQFYQFRSGGVYTDKADGDDSTFGFVYSSTFDNSNNATEASLNEIFVQNFPASTNKYELKYTISGDYLNGGTDNYTETTNTFYVDNYEGTPEISWNTVPYFTVDNSSSLFGIPSVLTIRLQGSFDVSGFASYIIPHSNNNHSYVSEINDTGYSFSSVNQNNISITNTYTFNSDDGTYNKTSNIETGTYNASPSIDFSANVYYLGGNSGSDGPTLLTYSESKTASMGNIFRDITTTYTEETLYTFNGSNAIGNNPIDVSHSTFSTEYTTDISSMLLYFNGKFVSGDYSAAYSSTTISPFSDWSSTDGGYAVHGPDYSTYANTGINGFKWIALDVTSKTSGNEVDLSSFYINNSSPTLDLFGDTSDISGYEAYIYRDGKFGALNKVTNYGATLWYNGSYNSTISDAKSASANGALQSDSINAFVDSTSSGDVYLIVGLPQYRNSYFTFS